MAKLTPKALEILEEVKRQILENRFGRPGEKFIGVREFAARYALRTSTALCIFEELREESLLMLVQKNHYLSHGIIPADAPLRKFRRERKMIALLGTHILSYYFPAFADKAAVELGKAGYELIIQYVTQETYREVVHTAYDIGVQALFVLADPALTPAVCRMSFLPCVTSGIDLSESGVDSVMSGGSKQISRLTDIMLETGCRKIFFVHPLQETVERSTLYKALRNNLKGSAVEFEEENVITLSDLLNNRKRLGRKFAEIDGKVGIICSNERLCNLVISCCYENAIPLSEKAIIAAFRTKNVLSQEYRDIITVEENIEREVEEAVKLILNRIQGDLSPAKRITVEPIVMNRLV